MGIDVSINLDFRVASKDIPFCEVVKHFSFLVCKSDELLRKNKKWYETGYSKKQALSHLAFENEKLSENTRLNWEKNYIRDAPLFIESIWDGEGDYSCGISYRKMYYFDNDRVSAELNLVSEDADIRLHSFIHLLSSLASYFNCSYINAESNGYRFHDNNVFPDRLSVGWMLYIPHIVLPSLIPQAAKVVPVMDGDKQKGTIVVSTEDIFDGSNKEHIARANDLEIRLLDLGLLPLMTEL